MKRISAPAMSKHVARLEAAGLVRRTRRAGRTPPGLSVTDEGERVLRSVKSRRTAWLAACLKQLDLRARGDRRGWIEPLSQPPGGRVTVAFRRTFASLRKHRNYRLFFTGQVVSSST